MASSTTTHDHATEPESVADLLRSARESIQEGRLDDAVKDLRDAERIAPTPQDSLIRSFCWDVANAQMVLNAVVRMLASEER